jgi:hypothetical protein
MREVASGDTAIVTDLLQNPGPPMLAAQTIETVSTYIASSTPDDDCNSLRVRASPYADATGPQLRVKAGGALDVTLGTHRDGIYGGAGVIDPGLPIPTSEQITLVLGGGNPIPPGWALWVSGVSLLPPMANPPRDGAWYAIQPVGSGGIIWFVDGLDGQTTITIPTQ